MSYHNNVLLSPNLVRLPKEKATRLFSLQQATLQTGDWLAGPNFRDEFRPTSIRLPNLKHQAIESRMYIITTRSTPYPSADGALAFMSTDGLSSTV